MRKHLLITLSLVFFCLPFVQARHIVGGEMTYECLGVDSLQPGNHRYIFTMKVYRDCSCVNCAGFDSAPGEFTDATVTIFKDSVNAPYDILILDAPSITDIEPDTDNPCLIIPPNICIEEGIYTFELSLPVIDSSYFIVYQRCCRNVTISNIFDPDDTGATYFTELTPEAQAACNNSPVFNTYPPTVICVNEQLIYDASATDPDGDQLIYELCAPLKGGSDFNVAPNPDLPPPYDPVDFVVPTYSPTNPMGGTPPVSINPATGLITGVPNVQGQFVVGICVREFRNGQQIGELRRDFQFNVTYCEPAVTAQINGVDAGGDFFYLSCGDTSISFVNESFLEDFITDYRWELYLPNGDTSIFTEKNLTYDFPGPGLYTGQMIVNPGASDCSDTAGIEVRIVPELTADFAFEYDTCVAGPVQFLDRSDTSGINLTVWNWDFGDGALSEERSPVYPYQEPGIYDVSLQIQDTFGCEAQTEKTIVWLPAPPILVVAPNRFVGCPPVDVSFENLSSPIDDNYSVRWEFGEGGKSEAISPDYRYPEPGSYSVSLSVTSPLGCSIDTLFQDWITVYEPPIADFSFSPDFGTNFEPEIQFFDRSSEDVTAWRWNFDGFAQSFEQDPLYAFPDTGLMQVELLVGNNFFCYDTIYKQVDIVPQIRYFLPNAFTPNEDGLNELFLGKGFFRGLRNFRMTVWTRWGDLVFETDDPTEGWNGRYNNAGALLPPGVYVYQIRYEGPRGRPYEKEGFATLVR